MSLNIFWLFIILLLLNIRMFGLMFWDKIVAQQNTGHRSKRKRIPERRLLWGAAFFGSVGAILGMLTFRHKTRKNYFVLGFALFFLLQTVLFYFGKWYVVENLGWELTLWE